MYLRTRDLQNIFYRPAWSLAEAGLFRYRPLSRPWKSPEMTTSKLYVVLVCWTCAYTKNHCKALNSTHICRLEVALKMGSMKMRRRRATAYHANKPLILHLFNGNIIHQARDDSPGSSLLAKVDLLENTRMSRSFTYHAHDLPRRKDHLRRGAF